MALDVQENRRVVNENIDSAEGLHRLYRHSRGIFFPGDIDLQSYGLTARRGNLLYDTFAVENVSDDDCSALRRQPATIGCANVPRSSRDDSDLATQSHTDAPRNWSDGALEHWGLGPSLHHSNTPIFHFSLSRCSLKSNGFHQGLMPRDSAMTRAALYPG